MTDQVVLETSTITTPLIMGIALLLIMGIFFMTRKKKRISMENYLNERIALCEENINNGKTVLARSLEEKENMESQIEEIRGIIKEKENELKSLTEKKEGLHKGPKKESLE